MENYFDPQTLTIFYQLSIAALLGITLGIERAITRKTAGMRTYGLISMGSALFMIISQIIGNPYMAAQIILGIGFIGGGLIVVHGTKIKGITTASGLWIAAGIGMCVGLGLYSIAIFLTMITVIIFSVILKVEEEIQKI